MTVFVQVHHELHETDVVYLEGDERQLLVDAHAWLTRTFNLSGLPADDEFHTVIVQHLTQFTVITYPNYPQLELLPPHVQTMEGPMI